MTMALAIAPLTRRFLTRFQQEYTTFADAIQGIPKHSERQQYALRLLNRLIFIYFLQKTGLFDQNVNYLQDKMRMIQAHFGKDRFHSFYHRLLAHLFYSQTDLPLQPEMRELDALSGDVPLLHNDLFTAEDLLPGQVDYRQIRLPDAAFSKIFAFFDAYHWRIDDQPLKRDDIIYPDIIGHIFEKYVNQKQMGAYYTADDVTAYICKHTIMPYIFTVVQQKFPMSFAADSPLWRFLLAHLDRYLPPALLHTGYLPVETQREYQSRKARCEHIKMELASKAGSDYRDFITYNIDAQLFARDIILQCSDSHLLRTFYETITRITILDPTCGSGAFLLAALNVLEPLYHACLERMQNLVELHLQSNQNALPGYQCDQEDLSYFQALFKQDHQYTNRSSYVVQRIVMNNLYGVDIMYDAVEICKSRLFLKMAAQLKEKSELASLRTIDFHIRHGNTLVGFTSYHELQQAIHSVYDASHSPFSKKFSMSHSKQQQQNDLAHGMDQADRTRRLLADKVVQEIENQWSKRRMQSDSDKEQRIRRRQRLTAQLNRFLASTYGIDRIHIANQRAYVQELQQWCSSHQPFHWLMEFHTVMQRGGFDIVIGNPPYVEYQKACREYKVPGYENKSYGNLYAVILERSLQLARPEQSHLGLIVPMSICAGERFRALRQRLKREVHTCWLANFEIFPCSLFSGPYQRLSIILARIEPATSPPIFYVTGKQRWYTQERPHLLDLVCYTNAACSIKNDIIPKLAAPLQAHILQKVIQQSRGRHLAHILCQHATKHFVYYQEATNYWIKATCCVPYYKKDDQVTVPPHGRFLYFNTARNACTTMALLNSSLFYIWFTTCSDGFHLSHSLVKAFPIDGTLYALPELPTLAARLFEDISHHTHISTRNTRPTSHKPQQMHRIELEEYHIHHSKPIIDEIDSVLARHYGFTDEELDFIINYEIKYRLGLPVVEKPPHEQLPGR
jgi:hypothetical protein